MSVWRPRGDAPRRGSGATPQRADQVYDPPGPLVAPGGRAGIFRGRLVVVSGGGPPGSGVFVYDAGNVLVDSMAASSGTGPNGGTVKRGTVNYQDQAGAQALFAQLDQGALQLGTLKATSTITGAGVVEIADSITAAGQPNIGMFSPTTSALGQSEIVCWAESQDASKTAFNELLGKQTLIHVSGVPAFDTTALLEVQGAGAFTQPVEAIVSGALETWHALGAPIAGWATAGRARYKMLADSGMVVVELVNITLPGAPPVDGTTIWVAANGLPGAYRPALISPRLICYGSAAIGTETPAIEFQTDGSIKVYGVGGTTIGRIDGRFEVSTI